MVPPMGDISNSKLESLHEHTPELKELFQALQDWNEQIKPHEHQLEELGL